MRKKIALYTAIAASAVSLSAAASAIVITKNTKSSDVISNSEANIYKYITFAKDTQATPRWTITGNNIVPVKPGKIFHTVENRPVASAEGYEFQYWSETNDPFYTTTAPAKISETKVIDSDITIYPVFKAIGVTKIEILGETYIPQSGTKYYQTYIEPSYAPIKTVEWTVWADEACQTPTDKATITRVTTGEHTGEGELTPVAEKGTGDIWIQAAATDGSGKVGKLKVTITPVAPTAVTVEKTSPTTGSQAKVGETAQFKATVTPSGATQKVNWIVVGYSEGVTPGAAEITAEDDTTVTIKGVSEGWVAVSARANGTAITSTPVTFEFTKATVTGITITGPTRMDIKDTATFMSKVTPEGTEQGVTWSAYETAPTSASDVPAASTIAEFGATGHQANELTIKANVDLENGSKYVYVRAKSNESGSTIVSNVIALRVYDVMSFMYSHTDANGKRWIYDASTLETNNTETKINRYCYDDPTATYTQVARSSFNEPITIGKYVTSIGNDFLAKCTGFNSAITFETDHSTPAKNYLKDIGEGFMFGCTSFDKPLALPDSLTYIGADFMEGCSAFGTTDTTGITIPASVIFVGDYFMHNCPKFKTLTVNTPIANYGTVWQQSMDVLSVRTNPGTEYKITVTLVKPTTTGEAIAAFRAIYADLDGTATTEGYQVWRTLDLKEAQ